MTFIADAEPVLREWDDAVTLAGQTPRMQLSGQIAALQGLRRRAEGLTSPACASAIQRLIVAAMNETIDGFLAFASGEDGEILATVMLDSGRRDLAAAQHALTTLPTLSEPVTPRSVATVKEAYPELTWHEPVDTNGRQLVRGGRGPFQLELSVDDGILYKVTASSSSAKSDMELTDVRTDIADFLSQTMPGWAERTTWLEQVIRPSLGALEETRVGIQMVSAQRFALTSGDEQQFFITVYLP